MGCAHFSWRPALADVIDIMVTRSHCLEDANADQLASWVCKVCSKNGLRSFYKPGLSGSLALEGGKRRLLRDAFEMASCVAAVAVAVAVEPERQARLASEIVWAAQHSKPIMLLYDSSQPFDGQAWQECIPELFPSHVVRYYGKGHEACAAEFMQTFQSAKASIHQVDIALTDNGTGYAEGSGSSTEHAEPKGPTVSFSEEAWQEALERIREAQPSDLPKVSFKGILRNRERWTRSKRSAPLLEWEVQEAVRYVMQILRSRPTSEDAALELLCASVGVSERVVSASLRILAVRMSEIDTELPPDFVHEVFAWSLAAVSRHVDSVDVCTFGMDCLRISCGLLQSSGTTPMRICSMEAEHIISALRSFPSCHILQRNGFALLLQLLHCPDSKQDNGEAIVLPGGGLARILTREGVAEMALSAIGPGDSELLRDGCAVLRILAGSSRHVKELLLGTMDTWVDLLRRGAESGVESSAVLQLLAELTSGDDEGQETIGHAQGLFEALYACLKSLPEQSSQVFTLLCLLTARHKENKKRCCSMLNGAFLHEAVRICCTPEDNPALRLAAGGMLVNICSDPSNVSAAISVGAASAADALESATGPAEVQLQRCGAAIRQLAGQESEPPPRPSQAGDGRQWRTAAGPSSDGDPFAGLFAMRQSRLVAPKAQALHEADSSNSRHEPEPKSSEPAVLPAHEVEAPRVVRRPEDRPRGPGWQRLPQHSSSAPKDAEKHGDSQEPVLLQDLDSSSAWGLGEWVPSGLAPPLSTYNGLSKDLWMGRGREEQELDAEELDLDADQELVSARTVEHWHEDVEEGQGSSGRMQAATQVSKGRTLRTQLDELRAQSAPPKSKPSGSSWFGRPSAASASLRPAGPATTVAEDRRARAVARQQEMLLSQMVLEASQPSSDRGENEIELPVPTRSGTFGKARSWFSQSSAGTRAKSTESLRGPKSSHSSRSSRFHVFSSREFAN